MLSPLLWDKWLTLSLFLAGIQKKEDISNFKFQGAALPVENIGGRARLVEDGSFRKGEPGLKVADNFQPCH